MEHDPRVTGPLRTRGAEDTLAAVDALLAEVCDDIGAGWAARHSAAVDVLRADLPRLLHDRLLGATGKRLRPVMCHWGWVSAGGATAGRGWAEMVRAGAALDLLHLFALVHDDIMDRSDTRRGLPALHVVATRRHREAGGLGDAQLFGDSVAVLVADLALSESGLLVAPTSPEVRAAWRLMNVELVDGQLLDVTHTAGRRHHRSTIGVRQHLMQGHQSRWA